MIVTDASIEAWNNFVFNSRPEALEKGSARWAAAMAVDCQGLILNGGINSFLTNSWELDPRDAVRAFSVIGAGLAANELENVLDQLGRSLAQNSHDERWDILKTCWKDSLNEIDCLSDAADAELQAALEAHVNDDKDYYCALMRPEA
jgi:hypothetical protein